MNIIQRHGRNTKGRDFAIGDIHGCFSRLQTFLDGAGFDANADRLFSVGDLVDRGTESPLALDWLAKPWFHAVRGNHEDTAIRYACASPVSIEMYSANGGDWFMDMAPSEQQRFAAIFQQLPLAIEIETSQGAVGIVHADCPTTDWQQFHVLLEKPITEALLTSTQDTCLWSRRRIINMDRSSIDGIRAVVVGHTPLEQPTILGNVYHIDTGGWLDEGRFTLLNLETLSIDAFA